MKILIIGNGITGVTAARHIRKLSNNDIVIISEESEYFFSRTALMYVYMGHMKFEHTQPYEPNFWKKNRIDLLQEKVVSVNDVDKEVYLENGKSIQYDKLIIASGSVPNTLAIKGENLIGVQALYSKQDLELMQKHTQNIQQAVVVGGGLIGIEMAEMLRSRNISVKFLIRDKSYWSSVLPTQESEMVHAHIFKHGIELLPETELIEIIGDQNGNVVAVKTQSGELIECQFVGLTVGVSPNISFLRGSNLQTDKGILINQHFETNCKDVYAAGDCAQFQEPMNLHPSVEQLWYTGKMQAEILAQNICGKRLGYDRGVWFNSAKFLDIEYQTYGFMFNKVAEDAYTFYWQHPHKNIAFRANFMKEDLSLIGFNFMGMRFRHNVAEQWILNKVTINKIITQLNEGFFDPEFSENHHQAIIHSFTTQFPTIKIEHHG